MGSDVKQAVKKLEGDNIYETLDPSTTGYLEGAKQMYERVSQGDSSDWADPAAIKESFKGKGVDAQGNPEKYPVDYFANPITTNVGGDTMQGARMGGRFMAGWGAGVGIGAATGAGAGASSTAGSGGGEFTGGLSTGAESGATMGTGTGSSVPSSGLRYAGSEEVLGAGAGGSSTAPAAGGLNPGPAAMNSFNAGTNLAFANNSGILSGGEGQTFSAPQSSTGEVSVGPQAAQQIGTQPTPQTAPQAPGSPAPQAAPAGGKSVVQEILAQMKANAVPLGILALGVGAANAQQRPMPSQEQMQGLSAEAQQTAQQLLQQYRSGTLSAGQAASLDQLTRQTKNQITQYFASIGQADSTSHQQALAQVDAQALQMKQQMLDSMLQQGLQAIGVAAGPLNNVAQYQMGQDAALRQAYGNFALAAGTMAGRSAGTPQTAVQQQPAQPAAQTASSLLKPPDTIPQSQALG